MNTLLITYDLNKAGQNYTDLIDEIKSHEGWCHLMKSTWLIRTYFSAAQVRDDLLPLIDDNDELFVVDVTARAAAWYGLSQVKSNWIKPRL